MSVRKALSAAFMELGIVLEKEAMAILAAYVEASDDKEECLTCLLNGLEGGNLPRLTADAAQALVDGLLGQVESTPMVQIMNAFEIPQMRFEPIRRSFYQYKGHLSLHGSAEDKVNVRVQRFHLIRQRVLRNPSFSAPAFTSLAGATRRYCELTEVKALLGQIGVNRYVLGCISQLEDGRYFLEDLSDAVPLDVSGAETSPGFITENSIVIAEGELQHSGVFKAKELVFPPVEARLDTEAATKGLNFFGGEPLKGEDLVTAAEFELDHPDDRIVVLADLWLDQPDTISRLQTVFSGFEEMETVPSVFILMGNFQSFSCNSTSVNHVAVRDDFRRLAVLIASFSRLRESSRFVFVPGPRDPGPGAILPRPPLPDYFSTEVKAHLPSAEFASNPCRIRYYTQELVVFRDDLEARMRKLCLLPPAGGDAAETMFENLAVTLLQQSHVCPLPSTIQPVFWNFDHALRLYPLPDALIVADPSRSGSFTHEGCACINPGSFMSASFAAYVTSAKEVEICEVPEDD